MRNNFCLLLLAIGMVSAATAQTKSSGSLMCGNPNPNYAIPVADGAKHSLALAKQPCTWSKPMEIAGLKTTVGEDVASIDDMGNGKVHVVGYDVTNMSNGDKFFVRFEGTDTMKDGKTITSEGTWKYTGGTGKLKGIKGGGTYKGVGTTSVEGTYALPK